MTENNNINLDDWANELQNSKLDLINLLQRHLQMVETIENLEAMHDKKIKKFLLWAESKENNELWYLIDAESEEHARRILLKEEKEVIEIRACKEVKANEESGISHRFTINEW